MHRYPPHPVGSKVRKQLVDEVRGWRKSLGALLVRYRIRPSVIARTLNLEPQAVSNWIYGYRLPQPVYCIIINRWAKAMEEADAHADGGRRPEPADVASGDDGTGEPA